MAARGKGDLVAGAVSTAGTPMPPAGGGGGKTSRPPRSTPQRRKAAPSAPDEQQQPEQEPEERPARSLPSVPLPATGSTVDQGAGFVLGLLVWGWIVMPFLKDGAPGVKKVLMAKFLNKAPDGSWLV